MADYQYQPDASDPVVHLREAMGRMDGTHSGSYSTLRIADGFLVDSILSYRIPEEKEDYTTVDETSSMEVDVDPHLDPQLAESSQKVSGSRLKSNLRLPPPPLFSRQVVPHLYKLVQPCIYAYTLRTDA